MSFCLLVDSSVSHKFLDRSLQKAGATRKTRAIFRAIYAAAEGIARVNGLHGKKVYSEVFKVRRGVIQGDIISPIFFILAMEQIFRVYDPSPEGVSIGNYLQIGLRRWRSPNVDGHRQNVPTPHQHRERIVHWRSNTQRR